MRTRTCLFAVLITAFSLPAASDTLGKAQYGIASVYSRDSGNKTASGEKLVLKRSPARIARFRSAPR